MEITDKETTPSGSRESGGVLTCAQRRVKANNRLLELEKKKELTIEEVKEWNGLLDLAKEMAGILKREKKDEKSIGQTKEEDRGTEKA